MLLRITNLLFTIQFALVISHPYDREKLLSLLETRVSNEHISLNSLVETTVGQQSRDISSPRRRDPPARRRGHSPCECPDNSDAGSTDCVARRFILVMNDVDSILNDADAKTGQTTGTSIGSLRLANQNLQDAYVAKRARIDVIQSAVLDTSNGTLVLTRNALKRLLNEESLMALSVNNGWMNLMNTTAQSGADANRVVDQVANATDQVAGWFTSLQGSEETITSENLEKVVANIEYGVGQIASQINSAQDSVWKVLTALSSNMGGSEDTTSDLADSLHDAADALTEKLQEFGASFPDLSGNVDDILGRSLNQMINDFQSQVQTTLSTVKSTADNKKRMTSIEAQQAVVDQHAGYATALKQFRNDSASAVAQANALQSGFTKSVQSGFDDATDYLTALVANTTQGVSSKQTLRKSSMTLDSQQVAQITSDVQAMGQDEIRAAADAVASRQNYAEAAGSAVQGSIGSFDGKHADIVAAAQTTADAAVDAVGTGTRASLDSMGSQYDALQGSLASQAQDAAMASMQTTSSLGQATQSGSMAMSIAGGTVNSQMSANFGSNLNQLVTLTGGSLNTAGQTTDIKAAGQAVIGQVVAAGAAAAAGSADAPALAASAKAGRSLNDMLTALTNSGIMYDGAVSQISQQLQSGSSSAAAVRDSTHSSSTSDALANTGAAVATADDTFGSMLSGFMQSSSLLNGQVAVGSPTDGVAAALAGMGNVDASTVGVSAGGTAAESALADMQAQVGSTWNSLSNSAGSYAAATSSNVEASQSDIDQALAGEMGSASQAVSSQMQKIGSLQTGSAVQLGQINTSQLDQVRAVAASIDTLMKQMNGFLFTSNGPLYDQVSQLPTKGQQLTLRMDALSKQAENIASNTQFSYKVQDPEVLTAQLYSQLRQYSSNALGVLDAIGANFNASSSSYSANYTAQVKDLATVFAAAAADLKSRLGTLSNSVAGASQALASTPEGASVVNNLLKIHSELSTVYGSNANVLASVNAAGVGAAPVTLPAILSTVAAVNTQASTDAAAISAQLDTLQQQAQSQVAAVKTFQAVDGATPNDDVSKDAAMARMNEEIANAKLAAQQAAIAKLKADSGSIVQDLAANSNLDAQAKANQADSVYDSVLAAKAGVSTALGNILKSVATGQTAQAATLATNDSANVISLQTMRNALNGLMNIFSTYMQTEKVQFASSDEDRSKFVTALALEIKSALASVDNAILNGNAVMTDHANAVSEAKVAFDNSDVDSAVIRINGLLDDWAASEAADTAKVQADVNNLPAENAFDYAKVSSKLTSTEANLAKSAITLITQFGKPVPSELTSLAAR